jgi:hypothetical protein
MVSHENSYNNEVDEVDDDALKQLGAMEQAELARADGPVGTDLDVVARRELALHALDTIGEVLEVDVSVAALMHLAKDKDKTVRVNAKRALRTIEAIGREDSEVVRRVGQTSLYHYVEGVMLYGASQRTYLGLMELFHMTAEEATALYALREQIADACHTSDEKPGFPTLVKALAKVGMSPAEAAMDTDAALHAMDAAGFFVGYGPKTTLDHPVFRPYPAARILKGDRNTTSGAAEQQWLRAQLETKQNVPDDPLEDM